MTWRLGVGDWVGLLRIGGARQGWPLSKPETCRIGLLKGKCGCRLSVSGKRVFRPVSNPVMEAWARIRSLRLCPDISDTEVLPRRTASKPASVRLYFYQTILPVANLDPSSLTIHTSIP